jgi:hypothetical protein
VPSRLFRHEQIDASGTTGALVVSVAAEHGERPPRRLDRPALVALVFGLVGLGYRVVLVLLDVPGSNSDEATFGLAAMHIATGRELPVFLYGQHYMGTLESYLAAPLFALFTPSWVLLRIPLLFLYAAFVYLMYRLTRRLYSPWLAAFTVGLLALGSERVIRDQLTAVGGRPEIKPAVVLLLLLAVALGQRRGRHRWLGFGAFGLVAGLSVWDDWLVLPYLAAVGVVLLVGCWRDLLGWAGLLVLAGFALGALPLIVDNLVAPPGQDSLSVLRQLGEGESEPAPLSDRLRATIMIGIPLATGLCRPVGCTPIQTWSGALYLPLLLAAAILAVVGWRRSGAETPATPAPGALSAGDPPIGRIGYVAQLGLVVGAVLTVLAYSRNALSATAPLATARYLSVLQISLPAVLWPLWLTARWSWRSPTARTAQATLRLLAGTVAAGMLAAMTTMMLFTTAAQIKQIPAIRQEESGARELAAVAQRAGIRYTYGEYWVCNRLIFIARERVVCAVLGDSLRPGQDRYAPYPNQVNAADRPAFMFIANEAADTAFQVYLQQNGITAQVTEVGKYKIYQPAETVRPPR